MIDLRRLRPSNITSPEFSHILLALFWPLFGAAFSLLEELRPEEDCTPVWCPIDDWIPFEEWFFLPYIFWFILLLGMNLYLGLCHPGGYRKFMYFIMLTYSATLLVYVIYPTCQNLRPESFERDNFLTRFAADFYAYDTNTNVCPSLHVIGSYAVVFGAWDTERLRTPFWKITFFFVATLIAVSTVFVKQHSVIDVAAGILVCAIGYMVVYALPKWKQSRRKVCVEKG